MLRLTQAVQHRPGARVRRAAAGVGGVPTRPHADPHRPEAGEHPPPVARVQPRARRGRGAHP
eukprot:2021810-Pyramimonas_sp.AAC.1